MDLWTFKPITVMPGDMAVERKSRWTVPVSGETIAAARRGDWEIVLTPTKTLCREGGSRTFAMRRSFV